MKIVIDEQLSFYKQRKAGCIFAAIAAKDPNKYSWKQYVSNQTEFELIDRIIIEATKNEIISTASIIFTNVVTEEELIKLTQELRKSKYVFLDQDITFQKNRCLGYRINIGKNISWISGFGNFDFLPKTRQAPYTEIVFRVKPRPLYKWYMKPPIKGVIHLADMDMLSVPAKVFKKWWNASLRNTKKIIGHSPDLHSAAKTTYSIPSELLKNDTTTIDKT